MPKPNLHFFCELNQADLLSCFQNPDLISQLQNLNAKLSWLFAVSAQTEPEIVQRLNQAGIPVTAWFVWLRKKGTGLMPIIRKKPLTSIKISRIGARLMISPGEVWDSISTAS